MRLTASDLYSYHQPSECDLRVFLRHKGEEEAPPGPYEQVLFKLAERHEAAHLSIFPMVVDLSEGLREEREHKTRQAVKERAPVLYQPALRAATTLDGAQCEVVGDPDFLIQLQDGYIIRDSKIAKRINDKDHPEILRQLELYGWLYEQTFGQPPLGLEVHSGPGDIVPILYDGGRAALEALSVILRLKQAGSEFYSPVGWSKCDGCGFFGRCWPKAEKSRDVALVRDLDQNLARALHDIGVHTMDDLLLNLDEARLADFKRPWGKGLRRVGDSGPAILRNARALAERKELLLQAPAIPGRPNYVMFDLEGLPPHLDELDKIYLWGLQVYGERPSSYKAALAGFGVDGDRQGWENFLQIAQGIFAECGNLPFVHWHHYERTKVDLYIQRFGDRDGIAARVRRNLLDLLPITQQALALPLPSYSLKIVEPYLGFKRKKPEASGEWAMAKYIEAVETENPEQRAAVMDEILAYNQEDLEATWAVLTWLKKKA